MKYFLKLELVFSAFQISFSGHSFSTYAKFSGNLRAYKINDPFIVYYFARNFNEKVCLLRERGNSIAQSLYEYCTEKLNNFLG